MSDSLTAILGAGVMGETLLSGLVRAGRRVDDLLVGEKRETRAREPGTDKRTPGRNAVVRTMRPLSSVSFRASAAFFTRLRKAWTSLSRLPGIGGSDGSYCSWMRIPRAKPLSAIRFT